MKEFRAAFKRFEEQLGFIITDKAIDEFEKYAQLLIEWNEKMNLTSIISPNDIAVKHFVDSLMILKYVKIPPESKLVDVGTGAGFPGLPIKIVRRDIDLTLLDSLRKRLTFLSEVAKILHLETTIIHARGEEAGRSPDYRGKCDYVTARAVSHLRELSEYTLPLVRKGGFLIAMKGPNVENEIDEAKVALKTMGGCVKSVEKFSLGDAGERSLIIIEKISQTPANYPRPTAKIAKFPLI